MEQSVDEIPYGAVLRVPDRIVNKWFENSPVNVLTWARPGNFDVKHVLAGSGADPRNPTSANVSGKYRPGRGRCTGVLLASPAERERTIELGCSTSGNPYNHLGAWKFDGKTSCTSSRMHLT